MTHTTSSPQPHSAADLDRLMAHLEGHGAPTERDATEQWIAESSERRHLWAALEAGRMVAQQATQSGSRAERWEAISQQLRSPTAAPIPTTIHDDQTRRIVGRRLSARVQWVASAAVTLVLLLVAIPGVQHLRDFIVPTTSAPVIKTFRTAAGQRARLMLPDSSTIVLAPESYIQYATNFGSSSNRTVTLEGQALFTVTHAVGVPFTVQTGNVSTRVLGTSFAIRRYPSDTAVRVVVAQGRIAVGRAVLTTGDVATATNEHQIQVARGTAVSEQLAWTEDRLIFDYVPLRDAIPELERWYGITIDVADSALLDRRIVAILDRATATDAIESVAFALKARAQTTGTRTVFRLP